VANLLTRDSPEPSTLNQALAENSKISVENCTLPAPWGSMFCAMRERVNGEGRGAARELFEAAQKEDCIELPFDSSGT